MANAEIWKEALQRYMATRLHAHQKRSAHII